MRKIFLLIFLLNFFFITNQANQSVEQNENILINRIRRSNDEEKYSRQRRDYGIDTDEIWGMAKKVFIAVVTLISACTICCIVTTVYLCIRCCCTNGNSQRKPPQIPPQPVIIQTNSPGYIPQPYQQQAPSVTPMWQLENHPMLPQPSAPPLPVEDVYPDRPPSYEKAIAN